MRFEITHRTRYSYGKEVALDPHVFRFCPRNDGGQKLIDFSIGIEPEPSMLTSCLDIDGNVVTRAWFQGMTDVLLIHTWCAVETTRTNPFDYAVSHPEATAIPILYPEEFRPRLTPYCDASAIDYEVRALSDSVAAEIGWDTLHFLPALSERIYRTCRCESRTAGEPLPSGLTLKSKTGACRDLAVLYMDACRAQGLAARFVSGYQRAGEPALADSGGQPSLDRMNGHTDGQREEGEVHEMHAWAEVYVPGGGWRGFDPSHALAAADQLVAVAAAAHPRDATPVSGTYRGSSADPELEFEIEVK